MRKSAGQFEHARGPAGVVVGAGIDRPRRVVVARATVAQMIIMGADDDHLIIERRIASRQQGEDIAVALAKGLEIALLLAGRFQRQLAELFDQIIAGRTSALAARLAPFELGAGQDIDRLEHFQGDDRIDGGLVGGVACGSLRRRGNQKNKNQQNKAGEAAGAWRHRG